MPRVFIGLGTNLGDKRSNIKDAHEYLAFYKKINIIRQSSVDETQPVDFFEQPSFLNQIILIETDMIPVELMDFLQSIEKKMGREKIIPKGPRIIDLDILLYDDLILNDAELKIPHPEIKNRKFILKHLLELDPELIDPISGKKYSDFY